MAEPFRRAVLLVVDGFGVSLRPQGNAVMAARTPTFNYLEKHYPFLTLKSSGISVGLSWLEAGNSEVGHMTMGTGRITYQYLPRIIQAIRDGSFFKNEAFVGAVDHVLKHDGKLHILGLLGTGSVHSYIDHLYALLDLAELNKITERTFLHLYTDGKDSLPQEGAQFVANLKERLDKRQLGRIASVVGRFYSMDRDLKWDRTQTAYNLFVSGAGQKYKDPIKAIRDAYAAGKNDTNVAPTVITGQDNEPLATIGPNDAVIFFDYREDSERQMVRTFVEPDKVGFECAPIKNLYVATMTRYEDELKAHIAFNPPEIANCLAEALSKGRKRQIHIAETEKYAHVTYFFNGSIERPFPGEDRELVATAEVGKFDELPEMRTPDIADKILGALERDEHEFIIANFANTDLVSHSGNFEAAVLAVESVDTALQKIVSAIEATDDTVLLVTSDHGKCEAMIDPFTGEKLTEHSPNNVPFYVVAPRFKGEHTSIDIFKMKNHSAGLLSDVAPTILELLALPVPPEMTGSSLLKELGIAYAQ